MKQFNPYIDFSGKCREALTFYQGCFGGEINGLQTYGEIPGEPANEATKDLVMHAEFKAGPLYFMATDGRPGQAAQLGNNIHLSIQPDSLEEQTALFEKLSQGGTVVMPLAETFWGARFGMLIDRFGIHWMLNFELVK